MKTRKQAIDALKLRGEAIEPNQVTEDLIETEREETTPTHTPTPWKYEESTQTIRAVPTNYWLVSMNSWDGMVNNKANAGFIVRAVNSHEALLNVLSKAKQVVENMDAPSYNRLAEAIKQAEGK